mgnify:FL=1
MTVVNQLELVSAICEHLAKKHPGLPAAARYLNPVIEAADLIVVAYARPEQEVRAQMGLAAWLKSDKTGISSLTMARSLAPLADLPAPPEPRWRSHPLDPSDFGRCLGLLEAVPELRPHLPAMADESPVWAALVARRLIAW